MLETYEILYWLAMGFCTCAVIAAVLCEAFYGATPPDADHDTERWV